jgi:very-short-patch-repair endonuclease/predicted nucleic acid-binding Zn ribbon protein
MKYIKESKKKYDSIDSIKNFVNDVYGDEYTVISKDNSIGLSRATIKHNTCGNIWHPIVSAFIKGRKCPFCFATKNQTKFDLIKKCYNLHKDEYKIIGFDNYINNKSKISVQHNCGQQFDVVVQNFFNNKTTCPKCSGKLKLTKDDILHRCHLMYSDDYLFNITDYPKNGKSKINIKHNMCGNEWTANISNILYNNTGCPFCKGTKGERKVKKYLDDNCLEYLYQHRFDECRWIRPLIFDFYLPIYNMCIEYDGVQHFDDNEYSLRAIKFFGGSDAHIKRKISDQKKTEFCIERGINLIRIDYKQYSKINNILDDIFKKI